MEHLYHVAVVTKKRQILLDKKVVAENEDGAKFEADVSAVIKKAGLRPPGVTVLVNDLGPVKVEREPEKVRIVKDDTDSAPPNNA